MVKIKNPVFSLGARGRLVAISYLRRRGINVVEKSPVVPDRKSPAQISWRHMYQKCAALWHDLSVIEKAEWEALGTARHMTGFAYWQSQCLRPNPGIYLPLQGGTMQGDIDMAKYRLLQLPAPTDPQEAARKSEVDAVTGEHSWMNWRRLGFYHFQFPQEASDTVALTANNLFAVPFYSPFATTITDIGVVVSAGLAGQARLGIYLDDGAIYPGALVFDCGTIDVTAGGDKSITALTVSLSANTLYWLAYVQNAAASLRMTSNTSGWDILGSATPDLRSQRGTWRVAFVYAPLPDPYPAGAVTNARNRPSIGVITT